jgi:hypothetical protein
VNVVREDPVRKGLLYAGTERGVYVSFDDGDTWQPLQMNLPATSVRDIEVKGVDLVIATHGRGFWILDDVSVLRQVDVTAPVATTLFAPSPAVRLRTDEFAGTPFPKDEPAAANPPDGAYIDYLLAVAPSQPVTLVIRDAAGAEVRRYRSADAAPAADPARIGFAPEWQRAPVVLAATAGFHRFVWPLRCAPPAALARGAFSDGVWAPPGRYTVELQVDGRTLAQPLEVRPDPRVSLPAAAYAEQFALARRIEADRARVASAYEPASALQSRVTARAAAASGAEGAALTSFEARLAAVTGIQPAVNASDGFWRPAKALTTLRYLAETLRTLEQAVDGADAAPSPDAHEGIAKVEALVPPVLASWDAVGRELTALNTKLAALGAPPVQ